MYYLSKYYITRVQSETTWEIKFCPEKTNEAARITELKQLYRKRTLVEDEIRLIQQNTNWG